MVWPVIYSDCRSASITAFATSSGCQREAAERDACDDQSFVCLHHVGLDQRGRHRVDGDAFLDEAGGVAAGQPLVCPLWMRCSAAPIAPAPRAAPDEILTMRPHFFARMPGRAAWVHRKTTFQIHGDGLVEVGLGELVDAARQGDAGVVDEDVDGAELRRRRATIMMTASAFGLSRQQAGNRFPR